MNKKHNKKKIIILIVYILLIGLCTLVAIKGCTTNITYALDATNWEQLNNIPVRCVIEGSINDPDLSNDTWSYISNGNSETGPAQAPTPAFYITDTYDGEQYDAIYIKTRDIQLRRFIYDEVSGDMLDYYSRTIWQDDWIAEQMEPHTIIFENLNNTVMASNAVKYALAGLGGQEQTGANHNAINSIMLGIINDIFSYVSTEQIYYNSYTNAGIQLTSTASLYCIFSSYGLAGYQLKTTSTHATSENSIIYLDQVINYSDILSYDFDISLDITTNMNNNVSYVLTYNDNGTTKTKTSLIANVFATVSSQNEISNSAILGCQYVINYLTSSNYTAGYNHGYSTGYELGNSQGYDNGYNDGYDDGASGEINTTWILSLMNTATSILNIEILPNIRIIYLVGAFIILAFVRFVIGWLR